MTKERNPNPKSSVRNPEPFPTEHPMNPTDFHLDDHALQALASGEGSPQGALDAQEHLAGCVSCSTALRRWESLIVELEGLPQHEPTDAFEAAVLARVLPGTQEGAMTGVSSSAHLTPQGIQRHLMGEISAEQSARSLNHLAQCPSCQDEATAWQSVFSQLTALPSPAPSTGFEDRVMARIPVAAIAQVFAEEQRPWTERVLDRLGRLIPRTPKGWLFVGTAAVVPATVPLVLGVLFLTNPMLSVRDIVLFAQWQFLRLNDLWPQVPGSQRVTENLESVALLLQQIPPGAIVLALLLTSLVIGTSGFILVRSLLLPVWRGRSHAL